MNEKELQKQNEFLLLQLKMINQLVVDGLLASNSAECDEYLNAIEHYSSSGVLKQEYNFISQRDLPFNFYNQTMNIEDYKLN